MMLPAEEFGAFDFGLTAAEERRARTLHTQSIVVDMLFQGPCGRRSYTEGMIAALAAADDADAACDASQEAPIRRALAGADDGEFERCWRASGVTAGNRQAGRSLFGDPKLALAQAQFDSFPWLVKASAAADIRRAKASGCHAGFMSAQDTTGLDPDLRVLQSVYDLGVRMLGLTYNSQNLVGSGCTDVSDGGLSSFGRKVVSHMNGLGIVIDTAHCGARTTLDACRSSQLPVVASHTSSAGLYPVDRAKHDDELKAIASTGGVIGVYALPCFLTSEPMPTIDVMLDHVDYLADVVGWQHVGLGTDWPMQLDAWTISEHLLPMGLGAGFATKHNLGTENLVGFDDYRDFPNITRGLVKRGYADEQIRGILGENFLRVFEVVCG